MSNFIKKLFGTLAQKPWEKEQSVIDNYHSGKTLNLSKQTSAVIVIFGVSTVLFSLILTGYLYTVPPEQDTKFLFNPNLLWVNTIVLFFVTYFFSKITKDLKKNDTTKIKKNLILVTHYVVISEVLNYTPSSGEIVVSDKNLNIIGNIKVNY